MDPEVIKAIPKEQLLEAAKTFMRVEYGLPPHDDMDRRNAWHERLGLLVCFVDFAWDTVIPSDSANDHT